jgi:translation elongation factor EF-4
VKLKSKKAIAEFRGEEVIISDPSKLPSKEDMEEISEPVVLGTIITPGKFFHIVFFLCWVEHY